MREGTAVGEGVPVADAVGVGETDGASHTPLLQISPPIVQHAHRFNGTGQQQDCSALQIVTVSLQANCTWPRTPSITKEHSTTHFHMVPEVAPDQSESRGDNLQSGLKIHFERKHKLECDELK